MPSTFSATINDFGTGGSDVRSASKIISNGVVTAQANAPVKHFTHNLVWGASHTRTEYPAGSSPDYDGIVEIEHNLTTNYVVCSIVDVDGTVKAAGGQMDMNYDIEVLLKVISNNVIELEFSHTPALNEEYYVTIMGAV